MWDVYVLMVYAEKICSRGTHVEIDKQHDSTANCSFGYDPTSEPPGK